MSSFGVVLSSGGSRGVFAHTGFMLALDHLGVDISASSGCSAGAVVGGVLASGTSLDTWAEAIAHVQDDRFWARISTWQLLSRIFLHKGRGLTGLSKTDQAIHFLDSLLVARKFEDCSYPFSSVAMSLDTVEKDIFREGPLAPGIMASAAMPGFYTPVEINGRHYCDGAIYDLAPAEAICCRYGLDVWFVHHVQHQDFTPEGLSIALCRPWTFVHVMQRLIFRRRPWYATGQAVTVNRCPCGCKAAIVVIEPKLPELDWPITEGGEEVLTAARAHALENLGPILDVLRTAPSTLLPPRCRC